MALRLDSELTENASDVGRDGQERERETDKAPSIYNGTRDKDRRTERDGDKDFLSELPTR